jgi:hypothetical protein
MNCCSCKVRSVGSITTKARNEWFYANKGEWTQIGSSQLDEDSPPHVFLCPDCHKIHIRDRVEAIHHPEDFWYDSIVYHQES